MIYSLCKTHLITIKIKIVVQASLTNIIPLPEQKTSYAVSAEIPLMDSIVYMPCGDDAVLLAE